MLARGQSTITCSEDEFSCTDGKFCLTKADVCDAVPDCADESDEEQELCDVRHFCLVALRLSLCYSIYCNPIEISELQPVRNKSARF